MSWFTKLLAACRRPAPPDTLAAVQASPSVVTPNPADAASLAKRFSELAYSPDNGFHREERQSRHVSNVVPFRRQAR